MGAATVRGGFDSFTGSGNPAQEFGSAHHLRLKSGQNQVYVYLRSPAPIGATIVSATLTVYARLASSGVRTLTCAPIAASWTARRLTWNNAPDVRSGAVTANVGVLADGDSIAFDVTAHVQAVASGARHFGWRISTDAATAHWVHAFNAGENKPRLDVVWSDAPDAPTSLVPSDGTVSVAAPVLQFDYTDVSGATELAAVQVQIDPAADSVTPDWDSGEVATTVPELDLSTTAYPGLADAATTYWRVRVRDSGGLWSGWSDWAVMSRAVKGSVTITYPPAGDPVVSDHTPTITWTATATQAFWRVWITRESDHGAELYDSGKRAGTATSHTIPKGYLPADSDYAVRVKSWDTVSDRVGTPGDPTGVDAWQAFGVTNNPALAKPTTVTPTTPAGSPWVDVAWSSVAEPDTWNIYRDGVLIESELDPADVYVSGSFDYTWRDYTASPLRAHVYSVRAVISKERSDATTATAVTPRPGGIWLADPVDDVVVPIAGEDPGSWSMEDDAAVMYPLGSSSPVRIVSGLRGLAGSLSGMLVDGWAGVTLDNAEAALWAMKANPARVVRLVAGDLNVEVLLGDVTTAPTPVMRDGQLVKDVSFAMWQTGTPAFGVAVL